jgi:hypothetical protein
MDKKMPNLFGKTVKKETPYAIYAGPNNWEWSVLKTYQMPHKEKANKYARWFVAARSPFTHGSYELGDTYVSEIMEHGVLVDATDEWIAAYTE